MNALWPSHERGSRQAREKLGARRRPKRVSLGRMRRPPPLFRTRRLAALLTALTALALVGALVGRATHAADPQPYAVTIEKTGNGPLDQALHDSSTLVSLRESAPVAPFALVARAQQDVGRFETALHSFGFYKGRVDLKIAGRPLDDPNLPDFLDRAPADPPVPVTVTVDPGPLFHLRKVAVEGAVPDAARAKLELKPGAPAVASDVLAARERLLNAMRDEGYALAQVDKPVAILEPAADALDVTFKATSGPRVDLGAISVAGLEGVNRSFVRRRLLVHPGEQFSPEALEKARQDLAATGVFSSVRSGPRGAPRRPRPAADHLPGRGAAAPRGDVRRGLFHGSRGLYHGHLVGPQPVRQRRAAQSDCGVPGRRQRRRSVRATM